MAASYFVTFRTADSLPAQLVGSFEEERHGWLARHPRPEERNDWARVLGALRPARPKVARPIHGACVWTAGVGGNRRGRVRLRFPCGQALHAARVGSSCPITFTRSSLSENATLAQLRFVESYTACQSNGSAIGAFWQKDYFDRLIRSPEHLLALCPLICKNPANLHECQRHLLSCARKPIGAAWRARNGAPAAQRLNCVRARAERLGALRVWAVGGWKRAAP